MRTRLPTLLKKVRLDDGWHLGLRSLFAIGFPLSIVKHCFKKEYRRKSGFKSLKTLDLNLFSDKGLNVRESACSGCDSMYQARLKGSYYEMGYQQGTMMKKRNLPPIWSDSLHRMIEEK